MKTKRRQWTPAQMKILKLGSRKGTPARTIAKKIRRSEGATRQKAFSVGLSLKAA